MKLQVLNFGEIEALSNFLYKFDPTTKVWNTGYLGVLTVRAYHNGWPYDKLCVAMV